MGYFRRHKLSDYTADECRKKMAKCMLDLQMTMDEGYVWSVDEKEAERHMEEWACYRELLARHEGKNKSQLD